MSKNKLKSKRLDHKIVHNVCFNQMEQNEDGTILKVKLLIHDFKKTPNGWGITEDTAVNRMQYLVNKPIKAKYYNEAENDGIDFLGGHEPSAEKLRGTDEYMPITNTDSIGVINDVYIGNVDDSKPSLGKALWADGVLWLAENMNVCNLLYEWHTNDIRILTSVEWFYSQSVRDSEGTEWIADPLYSALCVLNSEAKGEQPIIYGNYETANLSLVLNQKQYSEFEDAIESDFNSKKENSDEEDDKVKNEIEDVEVEVTETDETEVIVEDVEVDETEESKKKVEEEAETEIEETEIEVEEENVEEEVEVVVEDEVEETLEDVTKQLEDELKAEKESKLELNDKIISLNVKIKEMNEVIEELTPFKDQVQANEKAVLVKAQLTAYEEKFNAVGGEESFAKEETQDLIKQTLNEKDGLDAKLSLSDMLFDLAVMANENKEQKTKKHDFKQLNSKMDNLIPEVNGFVENYGFKA